MGMGSFDTSCCCFSWEMMQTRIERYASRDILAANHPSTSANQNVTINNPREKPEEWLSWCFFTS